MAVIITPKSTQFGQQTVPSMPSVAYPVVASDVDEFDNGIHVYVGTGGDVTVESELNAEIVTFKNVASGVVLPVKVKKILNTGTTASDFIGIE